METITNYFRTSADPKPVYALIRTKAANGRPVGDVRTWSLTKRETLRKAEAEWDPENFMVVRISDPIVFATAK